jgi:nitroreductase
MDVIEAIHTRRSIRSYSSRAVAHELIERVIWDAAQAPPPRRGQLPPWTFTIIEGIERIARYGERAKVYAHKHHPKEPGWDWTEQPDFQVFWGAPVVIIISGPVGDCCRAGQNLMLSAHARGLGTCWVGSPLLWLGCTEVKVELAIPRDATPTAALCLGYPTLIPEPLPRAKPSIVWVN